jgi:26S proteasome regulatory subunit N9
MGNHADYYRDALRFLGCVDLAKMTTAEQADRAFSVGLAAILGSEIYNFGELLAHPVLEALRATADRKWLVDLLFAFNSGDISSFEVLKVHWQGQADLAAHEIAMRQKMALLCLMEMTFRRPATDRRLSFDDIASTTSLPRNEVEHLVMRALSLGLIRGSIDEVDSRVHVTWVQPRVLDRQQIGLMRDKMQLWAAEVSKIEQLVEVKAADILT